MSASAVARIQHNSAKWLELGELLGASVRRVADLGRS